jgi:DNA repair exonuclease SbcCD nuclease subunit
MVDKILQISDLHIGREGLEIEDVLTQLQKVIDICIQNQVKILVIAGDVFDKPGFATDDIRNKLKTEFEKLQEHSIMVYIIPGNHDMSKAIDPFAYFYGNNVHIFNINYFYRLSVIKDCEILLFPYFEGFSIENVVKSITTPQDLEKKTPLRLAFAHGTYFTPQMSYKHLDEEQEGPYYPFYPQYIKFLGINYLGLGHFHNFSRWDLEDTCICYSGSLEPFSFSQTQPRKAVLISVDEKIDVEEIEIGYQKRWGNIEILIKNDQEIQQVQNQAIQIKERENFHRLRVILKGINEDDRKIELLKVNLKQHSIELKNNAINILQIKDTELGKRFVERVYKKLETEQNKDFWQTVLQIGVEVIQRNL